MLAHGKPVSVREALGKLRDLYIPMQSAVECQRDFLEIKQREGEKLDTLLTRLKDAVDRCARHWPNLSSADKQIMLVDQFIPAMAYERIQEKLVTDPYYMGFVKITQTWLPSEGCH